MKGSDVRHFVFTLIASVILCSAVFGRPMQYLGTLGYSMITSSGEILTAPSDNYGRLYVQTNVTRLGLKSNVGAVGVRDSLPGVYVWKLEARNQTVTLFDSARSYPPLKVFLPMSADPANRIQRIRVFVKEPPTYFDDPTRVLLNYSLRDSNEIVYGQLDGDTLHPLRLNFGGGAVMLQPPPGQHKISVLSTAGTGDGTFNVDPAIKRLEVGVQFDTTRKNPNWRIPKSVVVIESVPTGAAVFVNYVLQGSTPCTIVDMQPGVHTIRLAKAGYLPYYRELDIVDSVHDQMGNSVSQLVAIHPLPLTPMNGFVAITSSPMSARYSIGGKEGLTPVDSLTLIPGDYAVSVSKEGFYPFDTNVTVACDTLIAVACTLGCHRGSIALDSQPSGAQVRINGRPEGTTPFPPKSVPIGNYEIWLRSNDHGDKIFNVAVTKDSTCSRNVHMETRYTQVRIESDPKDAHLVVQGPGDTQLKDKRIATPYKAKRLSGRYVIQISKSGYDDWADTLWLAPDGEKEVKVKLRRQTGELEVIADVTQKLRVELNGEVIIHPNKGPQQILLNGGAVEVSYPVSDHSRFVLKCPTGTYLLSMTTSAKGPYKEYEESVEIRSGKMVTVMAQLKR